jgi:hypothetical protein
VVRVWIMVLLSVIVLSSGCYHATIETGLPASDQVISKSFASCWIYGLIPPGVVQSASQCPNGVSKVETSLSFVNYIVSGLTCGIYTPMSIKVTCAEKSAVGFRSGQEEIVISQSNSQEDVREAIARAAEKSLQSHQAVLVELP